jgi:hypothetical protein
MEIMKKVRSHVDIEEACACTRTHTHTHTHKLCKKEGKRKLGYNPSTWEFEARLDCMVRPCHKKQ